MSQIQTEASKACNIFLIPQGGGEDLSENYSLLICAEDALFDTQATHVIPLQGGNPLRHSLFSHLHQEGWIKASSYNTLTPVTIGFILHCSRSAFKELTIRSAALFPLVLR